MNMKKLMIIMAALIAAAGSVGAVEKSTEPVPGNDVSEVQKKEIVYKTKTYDVKNFNKLEVSSIFQVTLTRSSNFSLKIKAPEDIMKYVVVKVRENTLELSIDNVPKSLGRKYEEGYDVDAEISMPELRGLEMSGATKFTTSDTFDIGSREFDLDVSGASKVEGLSIKAGSIDYEASGASHVDMNGKCDRAELDISGATKSNLKIDADDLELDVSGASDLDLDGTFDSMSIDASGAVNASISGSVKTLTVEASGATKLKASGLTAENAKASTSGTANCTINATKSVVLSSTGVSSLKYKNYSGLDVIIEELSKTASISKL
jgi:hypothetical protein